MGPTSPPNDGRYLNPTQLSPTTALRWFAWPPALAHRHRGVGMAILAVNETPRRAISVRADRRGSPRRGVR